MRISAFILMLVLLAVQSRQTMVEVDYALNKAYIARVLCVEKDVPKSTCDGKCHLKKELAKVERTTDERQAERINISMEELRFIPQSNSDLIKNQGFELSDEPVIIRVALDSEDHSHLPFTPPELA